MIKKWNGSNNNFPFSNRGLSEILRKLQDIGLSPYEAKTYLALVQKGELTAIQVSEMSGVPKTRIYDILIGLERKGFCRSHPGKVTKYTATEPKFALAGFVEQFRKSVIDEAERREREAGELIGELTKIATTAALSALPIEFVSLLKDQVQIAKSYAEAVRLSKREIVSLEKAPYAPSKIQYDALLVALERNISLKSIYQLDRESLNPEIRQFINQLMTRGAAIRFLPTVPSKIATIDGKEAWLALQDPLSPMGNFMALVINHPSAVELFNVLFEKLWAEAQPYQKVKNIIARF